MRKQFRKLDIIILAAVLIIGAVGLGFIRYGQQKAGKAGVFAEIHFDGEVKKLVFLDEDMTFSLEELPSVVFEIHDHAIAFKSSDCPDQLCVHMGWQQAPGGFAACLPNNVMLLLDTTEKATTDIVVR